MKTWAPAILLALLPLACSSIVPEKILVEEVGDQGQGRFKIFSVSGGPVSRDVLLDSATGETWSLHYSDEIRLDPSIPPMAAHLYWQRVNRDPRTASEMYLEMLKRIEDAKKKEKVGTSPSSSGPTN